MQFHPERRQHVAAVLFIFVFNAAFFFPMIRHGLTYSMVAPHMLAQFPWYATRTDDGSFIGKGFPQTDFAESYYPVAVSSSYALKHGELPLWEPWGLGGTPGSELNMCGDYYPPRLLSMLFLPPIWTHDLMLALHLFLAGIGMYALMRYWGANAWGAVLAAIVWELNSHNATWLILEFTIVLSALLPWALFASAVTVRTRSLRLAVVTGGISGAFLLVGNLHWSLLSYLILSLGYGLEVARAARAERDAWTLRVPWKLLRLPLVSVLLCVLVAAPVWAPMMAWLPRIQRAPMSLSDQLSSGGDWRGLLRSLFFPEKPFLKYMDMETCVYITSVAVLLIPLAFIRRNAVTAVMGVLTLAALLLYTCVSPAVLLLRAMPFGATFLLYRWLFAACFGASVLAGFGLSEFTTLLRRGDSLTPSRVCGSLVVGVAALQLLIFARSVTPMHHREAQWLYPATPVISKLQELQGPYRALSFYFRTQEWRPAPLIAKVADVFQLRTAEGYCSLTTMHVGLLWKSVELGGEQAKPEDLGLIIRPVYAHDRLPVALLEKLSVRYLLCGPGLLPEDPKLGRLLEAGRARVVYDDDDGRLFELPAALPRAILVPATRRVADSDKALKALLADDFDAHKIALVTGDAPVFSSELKPPGELKAAITADRVNTVQIQAETPVQSMLVLNDSWAPGWKAYVDGAATPVFEVNYAFRGVVLPPGSHTVKFEYRPLAALTGLAVGWSAWVVVLLAGAGLVIAWLNVKRRVIP